ncbi:nucleoside-diphosphate sugar epimerase, partial [Lysobacter maris]
ARMREDLVFDAGPAARDFGYAPRPFRPQAAMFRAPA